MYSPKKWAITAYTHVLFSNAFKLSLNRYKTRLGLLLLTCSTFLSAAPVAVQLADIYHDDMDVQDFLVSEKFDGIRAIWQGGQLRTRNGTLIHAPKWFLDSLPERWLDGELWSKRQDFEFISSVVRKKVPSDHDWRKIKYMVFDAPDDSHSFQDRAEIYTQLLSKVNSSYVKPIEQWQINNNKALSHLLQQLTERGAEGLMLHKKDALFQSGRTDNLLKLKPYMDAEATVLAHLPGKGKYKDLIGSLLVSWQNDAGKTITFKIGSGLTDQERKIPPRIGETITFKYHGLTKNRVPRFASYLRIRESN